MRLQHSSTRRKANEVQTRVKRGQTSDVHDWEGRCRLAHGPTGREDFLESAAWGGEMESSYFKTVCDSEYGTEGV